MMQFLKNLLGPKGCADTTACVLWKYEAGSFYVCYGCHEIKVDTKDTPVKVWVVPNTPHSCIPVCCGDTNMVGVEIVDHGFIIRADIKTDKCELEWFAELF